MRFVYFLSANPRVLEGILLPVASAVRYMMYALLPPGLPTKPGEKKHRSQLLQLSLALLVAGCWLQVRSISSCTTSSTRYVHQAEISTGQWRTDVLMLDNPLKMEDLGLHPILGNLTSPFCGEIMICPACLWFLPT